MCSRVCMLTIAQHQRHPLLSHGAEHNHSAVASTWPRCFATAPSTGPHPSPTQLMDAWQLHNHSLNLHAATALHAAAAWPQQSHLAALQQPKTLITHAAQSHATPHAPLAHALHPDATLHAQSRALTMQQLLTRTLELARCAHAHSAPTTKQHPHMCRLYTQFSPSLHTPLLMLGLTVSARGSSQQSCDLHRLDCRHCRCCCRCCPRSRCCYWCRKLVLHHSVIGVERPHHVIAHLILD